MSPRGSAVAKEAGLPDYVELFDALADETRLRLLARLAGGEVRTVTDLAEGAAISRQAVRKHLRVLERVRMVHAIAEGREMRFQFDPQPVMEMKEFLETVGKRWEGALGRLKGMVDG